jgi:hypothetical protein
LAVFATEDSQKFSVAGRDVPAEPALLAAAALPMAAFDAPDVAQMPVTPNSPRGAVTGAFGTAARQTGNAFRIAGRAIRTAF